MLPAKMGSLTACTHGAFIVSHGSSWLIFIQDDGFSKHWVCFLCDVSSLLIMVVMYVSTVTILDTALQAQISSSVLSWFQYPIEMLYLFYLYTAQNYQCIRQTENSQDKNEMAKQMKLAKE